MAKCTSLMSLKLNQIDEEQGSFVHLLNEEFKQRIFVQPQYSLRSFARQLKVDASHLAKVLKGKRQVSERFVEWTGWSLGWSPEAIERAKNAPDVSRSKSGRKLRLAAKKQFNPMSEDDFQMASRWVHFVILEFAQLNIVLPNPQELARRMGVTLSVVIEAIERLKRLGALVETATGIKAVRNFTTTKMAGTSPALKRVQKEILSAAARALDEVPIEMRDQSGITMAIDSSKIPEAKERIKRFRRELMEFLQDGRRDRVYQMSISLFPAERGES